MRFLITISCCKVCNGYFDDVDIKKFEVNFNNLKFTYELTASQLSDVYAFALQQAKELYPQFEYGGWSKDFPNIQTHCYCHAILEQNNSIFQSSIFIEIVG